MSTDTEQATVTTDDDRIPLDESGETTIPAVDLLTGRGAILGKSGSGKSNSASVLAEELLDRGFPLLVVDTDGEYWGLKEQYEVLHVGADEECDLQVGPEHAEKLAELALEQNVPIILDVSAYLDETDASDLVRETARHLFAKEKKLKRPFLLLVEEVHEYIPEGAGLDETGQMLVKIGKRGRKHGLGFVGITQRPADVKKDFLTQANWLLWHRLTWDNDTDVVRRVVDSDHADAVEGLADGEAFLQADFLEADVQRVQVRRKRTFDAGATPDLGDFERPDLKSVSGDLVDELEEISDREEQRQDRIAHLERELDAREATIDDLRDELEQARDMTNMAEQFSSAMLEAAESGGDSGEAIEAKVDEIREEKNARIAELEQENESLREELRDLREENATLRERVTELEEYEQAVAHMDELREGVRRMADALGLEADGDDDRLRKKLKQREERVAELEQELERVREREGVTVSEEFSEALDFLRHEAVQETVERAAERTELAAGHFWDVLFYLADDDVETAHPDELTAVVDLHKSNISKLLKRLAEKNVVSAEQDSRRKVYSLNVAGLTGIVEQHKKRQRMDEFREEVQ